MSNATIEIQVPGLTRESLNLHELPTKKGGTWFALARMKDGQKVGLSKGMEFATVGDPELPISFSIQGEEFEAKEGTTRNGGAKSYVSQVVKTSDGRNVRVLVQASVTSNGLWVYTNGHPASNGVTEDDVL